MLSLSSVSAWGWPLALGDWQFGVISRIVSACFRYCKIQSCSFAAEGFRHMLYIAGARRSGLQNRRRGRLQRYQMLCLHSCSVFLIEFVIDRCIFPSFLITIQYYVLLLGQGERSFVYGLLSANSRTTEVHGRMTHWEFLKIRTEQKYQKIILITFIHLQKLYRFWKLWGCGS